MTALETTYRTLQIVPGISAGYVHHIIVAAPDNARGRPLKLAKRFG
jgi:hypothetical protein